MRVLYSFPTRIGTTGIGTTAWHQVRGLLDRGVEVWLVCGSLEQPLEGLSGLVQTMRVGPLKVPYRVLGLNRAMRLHDAETAMLLRTARHKVDLVHCWPSGALRTLGQARRLGIPSMLERPNAHTGYAYEEVAHEHRALGLPVDRSNPHSYDPRRLAREEREYATAGRILCPSDFVARTFRERGFSERRLARHRYGFDPAAFGPNGGGRSPGNGLRVAFVGRGEPRKGLHHALEAWTSSSAAENGRFVICGQLDAGYDRLLQSLMAHHSVHHLGFVDDTAHVLRECDALVLPSVEEGSALVTYEARACGCTLLVSDRTGAPCRHGRDALVHEAGDVALLRDHIELLDRDREMLRRLRAASLAGASELTWSAAAGQLLAVYDELVGQRTTTSTK